MKKLFGLMIIALLAVTLSACNLGGGEIPPEIIDCLTNPDDPSCDIPPEVDCILHPDDPACAVDCTVTPNDPECQVDCTVTPNDPECQVDCTVTPNDPECAVDCTVTPNDPECVVDCTVTPNDPSCPITCETGYELVGEECVLIVVKTPEEILADSIVENWTEGLDHVQTVWDSIGANGGNMMTTELNLEVTEDGEDHQANILVTDTFVYDEFNIIQRMVDVDIDDEHVEFEIILEETATGVNVYYNTDFLRTMLLTTENDPNGEVAKVLNTLDADEQWFMFRFDDTLVNLIELEVLKDMLEAAFFDEFGADVWTTLQTEIETDSGLTLADYNIDIDLIMTDFVNDDYAAFQAKLEAINIELLILDLDSIYLVPEIVAELTLNEVEIELLDPLIDVQTWITTLNTSGTQVWLDGLSNDEIALLLEYYVDPEARAVFEQYNAGTLDQYIMTMFINDPDVVLALNEVPGLDVAALQLAFANLDYDAFYLEMADLSLLPIEVYNGQVSYDAYLVTLATTAPQTASLLVPFSGTVGYLEMYKVYVDDVLYGIESLSMFEEYVSLDYYIDNDMLMYAIDATDDFEIETTVTLDPSKSSVLFIELMADIWTYADGFETFEMPYVQLVNCPIGEECIPFSEYAEVLAGINQLGNVEVVHLYDPSDPTWVETTIDLTAFAASVHTLSGNSGTITDASIRILEEDAASVTPPTIVFDVNNAAQEFAKFSLTMVAYNYLEDITRYYMSFPEMLPVDPLELNTTTIEVPLVDFGSVIELSYAFDKDLSLVRMGTDISDPLNPTVYYEIELVWLDGTDVFDEALGFDDLNAAVGPGTGGPDRATYLLFLDKINDDNYNITKLALVYLWTEDGEDQDCDEYYDEYNDEYVTHCKYDVWHEELYMYDGTNEMPMYIGYHEQVYDVSNHPAWATGEYMGLQVGRDLTWEIERLELWAIMDYMDPIGRLLYPEWQHMTPDDLLMHDGSNDMPMYVAYHGTIYDVSFDPDWADGMHEGMTVGTEVSEILDAHATLDGTYFNYYRGVGNVHDEWLWLNHDELMKFNGDQETRMFIAFDDFIFEVTEDPNWTTGEYMGMYAGSDITHQAEMNGYNESIHMLPMIGQISHFYWQEFTYEELAQYNGDNEMPMYIAYDGIVYDVSWQDDWMNGMYMNNMYPGLVAGSDVTEVINNNGLQDLLNMYPQIGDVVVYHWMVLTIEDLAIYDGTQMPFMFVAYNGEIYDVTDNPNWTTGSHNGAMVGTDITAALDATTHGASVLEGLGPVGNIVEFYMVDLTMAELAEYDGTDGMPIYLAYNGSIYEIEAGPNWTIYMNNGFVAGTDITTVANNLGVGHEIEALLHVGYLVFEK